MVAQRIGITHTLLRGSRAQASAAAKTVGINEFGINALSIEIQAQQ